MDPEHGDGGEKSQTKKDEDSKSFEVEEYLRLQADTLQIIKKTVVNFKKTAKDRLTKCYINIRKDTITEFWNKFKDNHSELMRKTIHTEKDKHDYFVKERFLEGEEEYIYGKSLMDETLANLEKRSIIQQTGTTYSTPDSTKSGLRLPKINLPTFNGNYNDWGTFRDIYRSLIHENETLNNVQKLHYLKSSVIGEAEQLLRPIQVLDANYESAWRTLMLRYNNRRVIIHNILKRLLGQRGLMQETAKGIRELLDTTTECLNSLKNNNVPIEDWDTIMIYITVQKLDQTSHQKWEDEIGKLSADSLPLWTQLTAFLETRFKVLEMVGTKDLSIKEKAVNMSSRSFHVESMASDTICNYCKETDGHRIFDCQEFVKLDVEKRNQYVQTQGLCFNCLTYGHGSRLCRNYNTCKKCGRKHHTLLHKTYTKKRIERSNEDVHNADHSKKEKVISNTLSIGTFTEDCSTKEMTPKEENVEAVPNILTHLSTHGNRALLATAVVGIRTARGVQPLRALIDPCSQESFISEVAAKKLQIPLKSVEGKVTGVGHMSTMIKQAAELEVVSRFDENYKINITAFLVKQVTNIIPTKTIDKGKWSHLDQIALADPTYHTPGSIDLLLGVNVYTEVIMNGILKGSAGTPIAQQTHLGWIISGGYASTDEAKIGVVSLHLNVSLDKLVQKFWESESLDKEQDSLTSPEKRAEDIYEKTVRRWEDGRYVVALPFANDSPCLPKSSREIAVRRLKSLETKFIGYRPLRDEYNKVMQEYLTLGHMERIDKKTDTVANKIYLPHFAVVREDRETTKVRVVFDASCKGSNNRSLNDELLVGPDLLEELRDLVMRWRIHKICYVADLVKMYRQIRVRDEDTDYQRIVWRFNTEQEIEEYRLLTVTFGTSSAPFLAIRTLKQLAKDEGEKYPEVKAILEHNFYMDDVLSGHDTEEGALEARQQLTDMMSRGGFELQKWYSNSSLFMGETKSAKTTTVDINRKEEVKTLGITWNFIEDILKSNYKIREVPEEPITKRRVLAEIASLFDPMGWIAPSVIKAKIFMQKLWKEGLGWDDELKVELRNEWLKFRCQLAHLSEIKQKRWLGTSKDQQLFELHGFADASMLAYAAVIYTRVVKSNGEVEVALLIAKTKIAPLKTLTLPRLELNAALLLSKLMKHTAENLSVDSANTFAWSDSMVALAWIKGDTKRWTPFVKNRVIDINNTINTKWLYVNTNDNPADPASRGLTPEKLKECRIWRDGPDFLKERELVYPTFEVLETELEMRTAMKCATIIMTDEIDESILGLLQRFSSLKKLLQVVARCRRWVKLQKKDKDFPNYITAEERREALRVIVKLAQKIEFTEEIEDIQAGKDIKRQSRLLPLAPFLDEHGIIRVGGRLKHAEMNDKRRHPIIISKDNVLLPLLLDDAHQMTLHGGPQLMTTYLRSTYWIIRAGQSISRFYRRCIRCARLNASTTNQFMGNLPDIRVKPARPFLYSGVDFAGPIQARVSKGRGTKSYKAYICLFICMVTKAIHLELVSDMTTQAFIAAYRRFISRRGLCKELWSDHGTNFVGAEKELIQMWKQGLKQIPQEITRLLDEKATRWKFIPPAAPNFGGLWEAGVKSTKYHLKRIIGDSTLTYEELSTLLTQIEACLNSRPLSPPEDDQSLEPLTPGHFLIGSQLLIMPEESLKDIRLSNLNRWQLLQKMTQDFWKRWQSEYLLRLQQRPKWTSIMKEFEIGDLVVIKDHRLSPGQWNLGRVVKKYPGTDGHTRTYDVRTATGISQRTVTKICRLPDVN